MRKDGQPRAKRKPRAPNALSRKQMVELCARHSKEMVEILLAHARGGDARMAVRAAQLIIERAHGAPPTREETRFILAGDKAAGSEDIQIILVHPMLGPDGEPLRTVH
jgi:hypothetical protein